MPVRRALYRQLFLQAWDRPGLSPTNWVVIGAIVANVVVHVLQTEPELTARCGSVLVQVDEAFVWLFTVEYLTRLWVAGEHAAWRGITGRVRYALTPFALIDLAAILPAYLTLGTACSSLRGLRLLRVLRLARFGAFSSALSLIGDAVRERGYELLISGFMLVALLLASATLMFAIEGGVQPEAFGSIPRALWWAVVTMTTVGYGDVTPHTALGRVCAGLVQIISIASVAVPTGILAASFSDVVQRRKRQGRGTPP